MKARRFLPVLACSVLAAGTLSACGEEVQLDEDDPLYAGAVLFEESCSGCHTLSVSGAEGSAFDVGDRERTDGPNLNARPQTVDQVLYAIRNGGFSGAIMPENIVVGEEARQVARFVAEYAGSEAERPVAPAGGEGAPGVVEGEDARDEPGGRDVGDELP